MIAPNKLKTEIGRRPRPKSRGRWLLEILNTVRILWIDHDIRHDSHLEESHTPLDRNLLFHTRLCHGEALHARHGPLESCLVD